MNPSYAIFTGQSNTRSGNEVYPALVDLTGKEACLVVAANNSGTLSVNLPAAETATPHGVIGQGKSNQATVFFPSPCDVFRLKLTGTCDPGDTLTLRTDGTVEANGSGTDYATAEEAGVDGQLVASRKL